MKNFFFRLGLFSIVLLFTVLSPYIVTAQNPADPFEVGTTVDAVFNWYTALYGAMVTVFTYLQGAFFPRAGIVPKVAVRFILIAVVAAALFLSLGWANALGVFIGFIGSALTYDKVLSPLGITTPKPIGTR